MLTKIFSLIFLCFLLGAGFFIFSARVGAETAADMAQRLEQQAELQNELKQLENQINLYQKDLTKIAGQKKTLQAKINKLKKQQEKLNLEIKATNLKIDDVSVKIIATQVGLMQGGLKSDQFKEQIGRVLELIYEHENQPFLDNVVSGKNFADYISAGADYNKVLNGIADLLRRANDLNKELDQQKQVLNGQQDELENLVAIDNLQQANLQDSADQQNLILTQTKGKESNYQKVLADTKKQAQTIRNRLYQLLEVSTQITFGQAVDIAKWASSQTGVRPAYLLAILTQESNLGKNVGTCNRPGDPPTKSWKVIMNPTRDQPVFLKITAELGLNPDITPVSCPMRDKNGGRIGWGGAMGPAQFIPSTWMGYKDKVSAITGKSANPWDIRDAFLAAAIKLAAAGAASKDREWAAAMIYFSGSTNAKYRFYGDSVVARADDYQSDIDQLGK
jgi:peptidoglycan hydrolase CwlO-like protein